jgi:rRNA biogenesis protein RRP5
VLTTVFRGLFDRALDQKLTAKKAKFLFKKWLSIETRLGDTQGQEKAKDRARQWVAANTKPEAAEGEDGDEEDGEE